MILKCLLLLLVPFFSFAQNNGNNNFLKIVNNDSVFGKPIRMPELRRADLYKFFEIGKMSAHDYVVNDDSLYRKIFSAYPADSLPAIDFIKEELLLKIYCMQCMITCHYESDLDYPCHRNACLYTIKWYKRTRKEN